MHLDDAVGKSRHATRRVRVLAIGHDEMIKRARAKVPYWCDVVECSSISDAVRSVQQRSCGVIALDPSSFPSEITTSVLTAAADVAIGTVLYTGASLGSAGRILKALESFRCELVCFDADNERDLLEHFFRYPHDISVPSLVATDLAPELLGLPADVRATFVGYFGGLPVPGSVGALVSSEDWSERGLERSCAKHGLAPPSVLLIGAHVARTWPDIKAGEMISEIARRFGWKSDDQYRSHVVRVIGVSPTEARRRMQTGDFAQQFATSLRRTDTDEPAT